MKSSRRWPITRAINLPLVLLALSIIIIPVAAIPTTGAVTLISDNNATFNANGVTGTTGWFTWGMYSGKEYLRTGNATATAGVMQKVVWDFPIFGGTTYYVKACDPSGCGNEVSFTSLPVTPLPQTNLGAPFRNMTDTHFDIRYMPYNIEVPYTAPFQPDLESLGFMIITGLTLFGVFFGMWLRGKNTAIPALTGFMLSGLFMYSDSGFGLGIPPEYLAIAQGAFCACIAGFIMSFIKKG